MLAVLASTPYGRVAPASLYVLLADLPGVPMGPMSALLGAPKVQPWQLEGAEGPIQADVYIPSGEGRHATVLIVNGALQEGRKYVPLAHFGQVLAQAGYTAVIPDYPDLLKEELTPASRRDVQATIARFGALPAADPGRIDVIGFCVGATLGLLAAEDPATPPLRAITDLSGYVSSADMIQVITTGTYRWQGQLMPYRPDPWVVVAVARSLVRGLPDAADQAVFTPFLVDPPADRYVAPDWQRVSADRLSSGGRALLALLQNRDPSRVPALIAALPAPMPDQLVALSPLSHISDLQTPVFIVADRHDPYIPDVESRRLKAAQPNLVHLCHVAILAHVEPSTQVQGNLFVTTWDIITGGWQLFLSIDETLAALQ